MGPRLSGIVDNQAAALHAKVSVEIEFIDPHPISKTPNGFLKSELKLTEMVCRRRIGLRRSKALILQAELQGSEL